MAQTGMELRMLLPVPSKGWDYRCVPPYPPCLKLLMNKAHFLTRWEMAPLEASHRVGTCGHRS